MTTTIFPRSQAAEATGEIQQQAWAKWQDYGQLSRAEHWRWTPLDVLRDITRPPEAADYQFSLPEAVTEDFGADIAADRQLLALKDGAFAALNVSQLADALLIEVPDSLTSEELIVLNVDMFAARMQFSRIHVRLGVGSRAAFWLDFNAGEKAAQVPVLSIEAAEQAQGDFALWFNGSVASAQLMQVMLHQAAHSKVRLNAVQTDGSLSRLDVNARLTGDYADFIFGGVQCLCRQQIADYHIRVEHAAEHGSSHQVVRGVLDDEAFGIFDGMIYVAHGAQKTDAAQDCRYIVLSETAKSHSVPRLEIYADDVKCAHGSTTGQLDAEALFYLQSRGIALADARKMLILSFLHESVAAEHEGLKKAIAETITRIWLGDGAAEAEADAR